MDNEQVIGLKIVELLKLKPTKETRKDLPENQRFDTSWGNKTLKGLGASVIRLVSEDNVPNVKV